jgi:L-lactate dehydrogenase
MDLIHGSAFCKRCVVRSSSDYAVSAGSHLVIVTAGARQRDGETRLNLVARNLEIFRGIIPLVVRHSPDAAICVVSNPVDIMTAVTAKLAGLPPGRVFGSGTALDSSRFRTLVAERLGVDARSVHGMILGEHGDSSVACWSKLNVAGVRLRDLNPDLGRPGPVDPENWAGLHKAVVQSAYEIIRAKGYTNWAIGLTCASIAEAVLRNECRVLPLSVPAAGRYGIAADLAATGGVPVHLSLPAVLGSEGVRDVLNPPLDEVEEAALRTSAEAIGKVQGGLVW